MNIMDLVSKKAITTELAATKKDEVISEMVDLIIESGSLKKNVKAGIIKKLKERETLGSTGIGKGVAIPHAKCSCIKKMTAAFGISKKGIDFKSLDGEPTYIFFLLLAPGETPGPHLKALAKISRLLDDKFVRDRLKSAVKAQDILNIVKSEDQKRG